MEQNQPTGQTPPQDNQPQAPASPAAPPAAVDNATVTITGPDQGGGRYQGILAQDPEFAPPEDHPPQAQEEKQSGQGRYQGERPSPGRIVHYVLADGPHAGEHRAAIITSPWPWAPCNLIVFGDQDDDFARGLLERADLVRHDEETNAPGTWHWPERA